MSADSNEESKLNHWRFFSQSPFFLLLVFLPFAIYFYHPVGVNGFIEADSFIKSISVQTTCSASNLPHARYMPGFFGPAFNFTCALLSSLPVVISQYTLFHVAAAVQFILILAMLLFAYYRSGKHVITAILLVIMLPELWITGYFASFSGFATLSLMLALVMLMTDKLAPSLLSAVFVGAASLFRIELLALLPAIGFLFWFRTKSLKLTLLWFAIALSVAVSPMTGRDISELVTAKRLFVNFMNLGLSLRSFHSMLPLPFLILALIGMMAFYRRRQWNLLLLSLLPFVVIMCTFGITITSPRYLMPAVPFLMVAAVEGISSSRLLEWSGQWFVKNLYLWVTIFIVYLLPAGSLGTPTVFYTHDGARLPTGRIMEPLRLNSQMRRTVSSRALVRLFLIDQVLSTRSPVTIFVPGRWNNRVSLINTLHEVGIFHLSLGPFREGTVDGLQQSNARFVTSVTDQPPLGDHVHIGTIGEILSLVRKNSKRPYFNQAYYLAHSDPPNYPFDNYWALCGANPPKFPKSEFAYKIDGNRKCRPIGRPAISTASLRLD